MCQINTTTELPRLARQYNTQSRTGKRLAWRGLRHAFAQHAQHAVDTTTLKKQRLRVCTVSTPASDPSDPISLVGNVCDVSVLVYGKRGGGHLGKVNAPFRTQTQGFSEVEPLQCPKQVWNGLTAGTEKRRYVLVRNNSIQTVH